MTPNSIGGPGNIEYTVQVWREGEQFIAHAMPLDVMSSGRTPDEAKEALGQAVRVFLHTASDMGTLDDILLEAGYVPREGGWLSPAWVAIERHSTAVGARPCQE